jgi:antitoxin (DNA-binding transcriptional repressor) of toxin-antitoxin stability system
MSPVLSITRDTLHDMADVTIRELRNNGGEIVDRASRGEPITITRGGRPVAELRATRPTLTGPPLLERWRSLPAIDLTTLRADVDQILDFRL